MFGIGLHVSATGICYKIRIGQRLLSNRWKLSSRQQGASYSYCGCHNVRCPWHHTYGTPVRQQH